MSEERAAYIAWDTHIRAIGKPITKAKRAKRGAGHVDRETKERRQARKRVQEFSRRERKVL